MTVCDAGEIVSMVAADRPILVWGNPGIGKTASIVAEAEADGYKVFVLVGNCRAPEDFSGLPHFVDGITRYAPQGWAVDANRADKALVVFDELTTSTPAVMAAMLRVVQERHVGDLPLGDHVRIVALANPPAVSGYLRALPPALANRFVHVDFGLDVDGWEAWMAANHRSDALGPVLGFLRARRDLLAPEPPLDTVSAGRAWPSPRSWDAAVAVAGDRAGWFGHVAAAVGVAAAGEFVAWLEAADLPDTTSVLADPGKVGWSKLRPDQLFAVLCSVVAAVNDDVSRRQAYRVVVVAGETAADLGVAALSALIAGDAGSPPFAELQPVYGPFLDRLQAAR